MCEYMRIWGMHHMATVVLGTLATIFVAAVVTTIVPAIFDDDEEDDFLEIV